MTLRGYLATLRRQLAIIVVLALLGAGVGAARYLTATRVHASTMQFYVSTPLSEGGNAQAADQFAQNRVNSYVRLFSTEALAERVIEQTGVELSTAQVIGRIRATADVGTVLIQVRVSDTDPARTQELAEAVALNFGPMVDELDNVGRDSQLVRIILVTPPSEATQISPDRNRLLLLGFAVGMLAGLAIAVARELLDGRVRGARDLPQLSGAPNLAVVPKVTDPTALTDAALGDALRRVRSAILGDDAEARPGSILVTSPGAGEGRTTVAVGLAQLLARLDRPVLLVDADLRDQSVAGLLDFGEGPGLAEVLADPTRLEAALRQEEGSELWVLPAGQTEADPADLLARAGWPALLGRLTERFDHVVIDSPALGRHSDAVELAADVDGALLVVRDAATNREQLRSAAEILNRAGTPLLGTVLNMGRTQRA